MSNTKNVQFVAVVTQTKNKVTIYVPDLHITFEGVDFIETLAITQRDVGAIYHNCVDQNVQIKSSTTYTQAQDMCKKNMFPTYVTL